MLLPLKRTRARRKARGTAGTAVRAGAAGTHGLLPVLGAAPWRPRAAEADSERRGDRFIAQVAPTWQRGRAGEFQRQGARRGSVKGDPWRLSLAVRTCACHWHAMGTPCMGRGGDARCLDAGGPTVGTHTATTLPPGHRSPSGEFCCQGSKPANLGSIQDQPSLLASAFG